MLATRQNKAKSTGVRSVLSWNLDHRKRQFVLCWLRVATRGYASKLKVRAAVFGVREFDATDCEFS